jgi:flagellar L-ring protein precursor FlgH
VNESSRAFGGLGLGVIVLAGLLASPLPARADDLPQPFGSSFYADHKAHLPGEILTVLIVEESSATESAQTNTSKDDGIHLSASSPTRAQRQWQAALGDQFAGSGQIARSGELLARLSVLVDGVDRNGNLLVHGEQDIKLNGERQKIRLTGMVRPEDIGPDNTVPSWRIENAQIVFLGKGVLGDSQSPGLVVRILRWLGIY